MSGDNPAYADSVTDRMIKTITFVLAIALATGSSLAAAAPYQWRDASGHMVYSDQPPPPGIRPSQLPRQPAVAKERAAEQPLGQNGSAPRDAGDKEATEPPANSPAPATATPAPRKTLAERVMESNKRRTERTEAEKKQEQEALREQKTTRACDDMRTSLRTLESGARVKTVGENGVRRFVDKLERAQRVAELQRSIADGCPGQ